MRTLQSIHLYEYQKTVLYVLRAVTVILHEQYRVCKKIVHNMRAHLERQLIHEVDLVRVRDVTIFEVLDGYGECRAEQADLSLPGAVAHQLL